MDKPALRASSVVRSNMDTQSLQPVSTGRLMKDSPLILVPQYFGSTVFDRSTSKYLPFGADTTAVLIRLTREPFNTVLAHVQDAEYRTQLIRFFEDFYKLGFSRSTCDLPELFSTSTSLRIIWLVHWRCTWKSSPHVISSARIVLPVNFHAKRSR